MSGKESIEPLQELESIQYKDVYFEPDMPFENLSKGIVKRMIYFGFSLFLVFVVLSLVIKLPREVHLPFELKGGLEEVFIQFPEEVYIQQSFISAGQQVQEGDPLIAITSNRIAGIVDEIEIWNIKLEIYNTQQTRTNETSLQLLEAKKLGIEKELIQNNQHHQISKESKAKELEILQSRLEISKKQYERDKKLFDEQVISEAAYEISFQAFQEAGSNLAKRAESYDRYLSELDTDMQQLKNNLQVVVREIEKLKAEHDFEKANIVSNLQLAKNKLNLYFGSSSIEENCIHLLSPARGTIAMVTARESEVPAGEILLRIHTDSLSYFAYAEATPDAIGKLTPGAKAVLKYASFPHYYYGTMKATVESVSKSPDANGNFPVRLIITDTGKLDQKVTKGMTGRVSIVIEEKSVFDFVLRVFLKYTSFD